VRTRLPFVSWLSTAVWENPEFATTARLLCSTEPVYRVVLELAAQADAQIGT
jgi:hypothetical protein